MRPYFFHYNLAQFVTFPTHLGGNLLDLVICSPDLSANVFPLSSSFLVSDHYPLSLSFSIPFLGLQKSSTSWFYNYKKTDFDSLNSFLLDYDFSPLTESADVEFIWSFFKGIVLSAISLFTPLAKVKTNSLPKWFNSTTRHRLHSVHSLRKRYKCNQSSSNLLHLSSAECLFTA